jgi:drug/metabolite transporter (DMT)-like permease
VASSVTYVTPLFAVLAGSVFLAEPLAWYQPVGGLIVLLGVAITQGRVRIPGLARPADPVRVAIAPAPAPDDAA